MELDALAQRKTHLRRRNLFPRSGQNRLYLKGLAVVVNQAFIHIGMEAILQCIVLGMDIPCAYFALTGPFEWLGLQRRRKQHCHCSRHRKNAVFEFHGTLFIKSFTMQ